MPSWEKQEKGWYTSSAGGVTKELTGWWFWPADSLGIGPAGHGPFRSMKEAMAFAYKASNEMARSST